MAVAPAWGFGKTSQTPSRSVAEAWGIGRGPRATPRNESRVAPPDVAAERVLPSNSTGEWGGFVRLLVCFALTVAIEMGTIPVTGSVIAWLPPFLVAYVVLLTVAPQMVPALRKPDLIIVLDIVVITFIVMMSGDLGSPFLYLYYLAILEAAARMDLKQAFAAATATAATIALLWTWMGQGSPLGPNGVHIGAFVGGGFFLALYFGTLIQEGRTSARLARAYDTTLEGWSRALDLRDEETEGHTRRVAELTLRLGRTLGLSKPDLVQLWRGALLHDIGKMGIPDAILHKPGPLTEHETAVMRHHPVYAYELLAPIEYLRPALDVPYGHHEKWDGTGYPRGLKGEQIPLAARIFAVVDVWDALRWDRWYRSAWTLEQTRQYLREQTGTHFDPHIVDVFLRMVEDTQ
ncbi:MAG TPA: HD-GYP domain-containing protein [bacterium]|nr:HD-GYP domain-containing protein [bacterium]